MYKNKYFEGPYHSITVQYIENILLYNLFLSVSLPTTLTKTGILDICQPPFRVMVPNLFF